MLNNWNQRIKDNWSEEYRKYLASPEWKTKRKQVMDGCGHTCECGAKATQVHHKTYDSVGDEQLEHLEAVCADCHAERHQIMKKERRKPDTRLSTTRFDKYRKNKTRRGATRRRKRTKSTYSPRNPRTKRKKRKLI